MTLAEVRLMYVMVASKPHVQSSSNMRSPLPVLSIAVQYNSHLDSPSLKRMDKKTNENAGEKATWGWKDGFFLSEGLNLTLMDMAIL